MGVAAENRSKTGVNCSEADDRALRCASLHRNGRKPGTTHREAYHRDIWWASLQKNCSKTGVNCSEADVRALRCASLHRNDRKPGTTHCEAYNRDVWWASLQKNRGNSSNSSKTGVDCSEADDRALICASLHGNGRKPGTTHCEAYNRDVWWASLQKNSSKTGVSCSEADDRTMRCASRTEAPHLRQWR